MTCDVNAKRLASTNRSEAANDDTKPCLFLLSFLLNQRPNRITRDTNDDDDDDLLLDDVVSAKNSLTTELSLRMVSSFRRITSPEGLKDRVGVRVLEVLLRLRGILLTNKNKQIDRSV